MIHLVQLFSFVRPACLSLMKSACHVEITQGFPTQPINLGPSQMSSVDPSTKIRSRSRCDACRSERDDNRRVMAGTARRSPRDVKTSVDRRTMNSFASEYESAVVLFSASWSTASQSEFIFHPGFDAEK